MLIQVQLADRAIAGECIEDADYCLAQLQEVVRGKKKMFQTEVGCLGYHDAYNGADQNRWAGPRATRRFAKLRRAPYLQRLIPACATLIRRGEFCATQTCLKLLAIHGVKQLGAQGTLVLQQQRLPHGLAPLELAILGDQRAVEQLIARFGSRQECSEYCSSEGKRELHCERFASEVSKRNKWQQKKFDENKIAILNALWHLASPRSRSFLEEVAKTDPGKLVREQAKKTLARLD